MPVAIADTSVLQYLHQLGRLDLLPVLFGAVLVPAAVEAELQVGARLGCDVPDVRGMAGYETCEVEILPALAADPRLGAGELAVLSLGRQMPDSDEALLLLDDRQARRVADASGLDHTGTLGVLLLARQRGLVERLRPDLDRLVSLGFRLSRRLHQRILDTADES